MNHCTQQRAQSSKEKRLLQGPSHTAPQQTHSPRTSLVTKYSSESSCIPPSPHAEWEGAKPKTYRTWVPLCHFGGIQAIQKNNRYLKQTENIFFFFLGVGGGVSVKKHLQRHLFKERKKSHYLPWLSHIPTIYTPYLRRGSCFPKFVPLSSRLPSGWAF